MAETQMFDWPEPEEPPMQWLSQLPVEAVVTHQGRAIGWWDGDALQPVRVAGIWDGRQIIPDPGSGELSSD